MQADPTIKQYIDARTQVQELTAIGATQISRDFARAKLWYPNLTDHDILAMPVNKFNQMLNIAWQTNATPVETFNLAGTTWHYKRSPNTAGFNLTVGTMITLWNVNPALRISQFPHMLAELYMPETTVENPSEVLLHAKLSYAVPFAQMMKQEGLLLFPQQQTYFMV